ncbi:hypothetical protein FRC02_003201 [Tulasnella sp. 418]|nr:hypothetical protein FRC02_003201 [Tulasnella sp. 418]
MGFSLKPALAALVALAINFGCEVGLSEGAGIPGSGTAPQVWSSTHFTTIINTFPTKSYANHSITSLHFSSLHHSSLRLHPQEKEETYLCLVRLPSVLLQQRGPLSFVTNTWLIIIHKHRHLPSAPMLRGDLLPIPEWDMVVAHNAAGRPEHAPLFVYGFI